MNTKNTIDWKSKLGEALNVVQTEFGKTKEICKKMIDASTENSILNESLQELGQITYDLLEKNELQLESERVQELIAKIQECRTNLEKCEEEIEEIKK